LIGDCATHPGVQDGEPRQSRLHHGQLFEATAAVYHRFPRHGLAGPLHGPRRLRPPGSVPGNLRKRIRVQQHRLRRTGHQIDAARSQLSQTFTNYPANIYELSRKYLRIIPQTFTNYPAKIEVD